MCIAEPKKDDSWRESRQRTRMGHKATGGREFHIPRMSAEQREGSDGVHMLLL